MNNSVRSMLAAAVLVGAAAAPAQASADDGGEGAASATVLRTDLDVRLVDDTVRVPLRTTLNAVRTRDGAGVARRTALTAHLDGVKNGKPFEVLAARVADAETSREADVTRGSVTLADAKVHLPGLPLLPVVELDAVTAQVECRTGEQPEAETAVPGTVRVLGKRVTLNAEGPTSVEVPEVGEVRLEVSRTATTSRTAAATALELDVSVDPLDLGVAEVSGAVTLAEATCEAPAQQDPPEEESGEEQVTPQTVTESEHPVEPATETELAATGGGSVTPYLVGGAALLAAGGGSTALALRRRSAARR
ncbi:SCO1860 family LAETG-anchored protein [Streptomyces sp. TR02-1]|uniref:SCO1860 family LAETG-anchored protein n=1 Tax=Streptomyces sp. TR02-1 TaxID=3385977 RepID=UPI0039A02FBC